MTIRLSYSDTLSVWPHAGLPASYAAVTAPIHVVEETWDTGLDFGGVFSSTTSTRSTKILGWGDLIALAASVCWQNSDQQERSLRAGARIAARRPSLVDAYVAAADTVKVPGLDFLARLARAARSEAYRNMLANTSRSDHGSYSQMVVADDYTGETKKKDLTDAIELEKWAEQRGREDAIKAVRETLAAMPDEESYELVRGDREVLQDVLNWSSKKREAVRKRVQRRSKLPIAEACRTEK
jgi:hypothetical protein